MKILLIAPAAPPKNSPESIQVGRVLACFSSSFEICLVTTPVTRGWEWRDASLSLVAGIDHIITIQLPCHRFAHRVLSSRFLSAIHLPDAEFWMPYCCSAVIKQLPWQPDVIYSRSSPFSAAMLACRLKDRLRVPWLMHLSDPWVDSIHIQRKRFLNLINQQLEQKCFFSADHITLTTQKQVDFYKEKYSDKASNISCIANVSDPASLKSLSSTERYKSHWPVRFVYTGSIYGQRSPEPLLRAIRLLLSLHPRLHDKLEFLFIGNAEPSVRDLINQVACCHHLGIMSYVECQKLQQSADILVSIENHGSHPLRSAILCSKVVDYLCSNRPILSIGDLNSITAAYCRSGYGWSFSSEDTSEIAEFILDIATNPEQLSSYSSPGLPDELHPVKVTARIESILSLITDRRMPSVQP